MHDGSMIGNTSCKCLIVLLQFLLAVTQVVQHQLMKIQISDAMESSLPIQITNSLALQLLQAVMIERLQCGKKLSFSVLSRCSTQ